MSSEYAAVPLSELRDRLGKVVTEVAESGHPVVVTREVLQAGMLPPAYFDERARLDTIAHLDAKIAEHNPNEITAAEEWLSKLTTAAGAGAAGAA